VMISVRDKTFGAIAAEVHFSWTGHDQPRFCSPACVFEIATMKLSLERVYAEALKEAAAIADGYDYGKSIATEIRSLNEYASLEQPTPETK
jgi:hypothetical protein